MPNESAPTPSFAIKADRFVLPGGLFGPGYLPVVEGTFGVFSTEAPEGLEVVDRTGSWVAPGYVDTHIHGYVGHDVMDCDAAGVDAASLELARRGTTSWTPTTLTQPVDQIEAACASLAEAAEGRPRDFPGARVQGIFLEGPFFTQRHAGAQNPANMCDPSIELLCRWQQAAHGLICESSLAPERDGSAEYCAEAERLGVTCALGHSDATYEQGMAAVAGGATVFVHTYNGMSGHHHRAPGLLTCAMTSEGTYAEIICDGMHVDPCAVAAVVRAKGWEHTVLVSDCLGCAGMPDGDYRLGDLPVRLADGLARLVTEDGGTGNIAGSTLTMARAAKNVFSWGIATAEQAIRMASEVPARSCGIDDACGSIKPGRDADFNVLAPDLSLRETYIAGRLVPVS